MRWLKMKFMSLKFIWNVNLVTKKMNADIHVFLVEKNSTHLRKVIKLNLCQEPVIDAVLLR